METGSISWVRRTPEVPPSPIGRRLCAFFFFAFFACSKLLSLELFCAVSLRAREGTSRTEIKPKSGRCVSARRCSCKSEITQFGIVTLMWRESVV